MRTTMDEYNYYYDSEAFDNREEDNDGDYYNDGENDVRTCLSCQEFKANKHSHAYVKAGLCWDCYEEGAEGFEK